ncbi:MAG TPA: hypothetical protein VGC84_17985, partial [Ilumatobacteraceae bacterium]
MIVGRGAPETAGGGSDPLPAPGLRRSLAVVALLFVVAIALLAGATRRAAALYSTLSPGTGTGRAAVVPAGNTPTAVAAGRDMTVSWAPSTMSGGTPMSGYVVRRFDNSGVEDTVLSGCAGIVAGVSCVENAVPVGTWRYTVTPRLGAWIGPASALSAPQVITSATLSIPSSTINHLPATLSGTISGYVSGATLSFHLDSATGPVLNGTPATVPSGGSTAVTIDIPAGTDDFPHSVFAVDSFGTSASNPISIIDPPLLTDLRMYDTNGNGRIDRVLATFSKTLATYTAGNGPWTLANVPSGGALASVSVTGNVATLSVTEGAGAADTAVGSFTVALASNASGIRDAAGQTATFSATAPIDAASPAIVTKQFFDNDGNGKVDQVTAVFSETLSTYTAGTAPWTLANMPSGGTLSSVAVATTTATLTVAEGAGAADTSPGSFTIALVTNAGGIRDAAGNLSSFTAVAPADKATPVRLAMVMNDVNANGKVDQVVVTFSEPLASYTAGTTPWTLTSAPSGATLSSVAVSGSSATVTLAEGAGAASTALGSFKVTLASNATGVRDAAANLSSFVATAPTDGAKPVLLTLSMNDSSGNGKVDQVTAVFSETLSTYTAGTTPWTLANVPSGGTLASVAVATTTATLTITEGAGAVDTTVGSFTIALASNAGGVQDAAGNLSSFVTSTPLDKSKPARVAMVMNDVNGNGKVDQVVVTFSEPLASYTAGTAPWTLANVPSGGTLASVSVSGSTATLSLTEGAAAANTAVGTFTVTLASNAAGIQDPAANLSSFVATAPSDGAKPVLLTLSMNDSSGNGKVDQVTAVFSETLSTYTAGTTPWTLANVPSGGTLASVAVATTT